MLDRVSGWFGRLLGRRAAGAAGGSDGQLAEFVDALRAVAPDFERYCKVAGDDAGEAAARTVYAALPPSGKVSRNAVARELMVRLAEEAGEEADADAIAQLSERQVAIAARRAGIPI